MEGSSSGVLEWHHICASVAHSAMKEIYCIVSCANQGPGKKKTQEIGVTEAAIVKESRVALGTQHSRRK